MSERGMMVNTPELHGVRRKEFDIGIGATLAAERMQQWPKRGDTYYYVDVSMRLLRSRVRKYVFDGDPVDLKFACIGNCFRTEAEAEEVAVKVQVALREIFRKEMSKNEIEQADAPEF